MLQDDWHFDDAERRRRVGVGRVDQSMHDQGSRPVLSRGDSSTGEAPKAPIQWAKETDCFDGLKGGPKTNL